MKDFLESADQFVTALENDTKDATSKGADALRELANYLKSNPSRGSEHDARKCVDLMDRCNKVGAAIVPPTPGSIPYTVPNGSNIPSVIPFGVPGKPDQTISLQCVMLACVELLKTLPPPAAPGTVEPEDEPKPKPSPVPNPASKSSSHPAPGKK